MKRERERWANCRCSWNIHLVSQQPWFNRCDQVTITADKQRKERSSCCSAVKGLRVIWKKKKKKLYLEGNLHSSEYLRMVLVFSFPTVLLISKVHDKGSRFVLLSSLQSAASLRLGLRRWEYPLLRSLLQCGSSSWSCCTASTRRERRGVWAQQLSEQTEGKKH